MTAPGKPRRKLTPDQYAKLRLRGRTDEEMEAAGLELPATRRLGQAGQEWQQVDESGQVTTLPAGSPQPLREESAAEHALGAARAASQGLTLGWGEEIAGGAAALQRINQALLQGHLPSAEDLKAAYEHTRDTERAADAAYQQAHPKESAVVRTAGAAVPTTLAALLMPAAVPGTAIPAVAQTIAGGSAIGGGVGLVGGLGTAQGAAGEQAQQTKTATTAGLVGGALLPGAVLGARAAAPLVKPVVHGALETARFVRNPVGYTGRALGRGMLRGMVGEAPPPSTVLTSPRMPLPPEAAPPPADPRVAATTAALRKIGVPEEEIPGALRAAGFGEGPRPPSGLRPPGAVQPQASTTPPPAPETATASSVEPIPIPVPPGVAALRQLGIAEEEIPGMLQTAQELGIAEADLPAAIQAAVAKLPRQATVLPETAARVQPGVTHAQLEYGALRRAGLPGEQALEGARAVAPQGVPPELNPNDPANLEMLLRGTLGKLQRGEVAGSLRPGGTSPASVPSASVPRTLGEAIESDRLKELARRRDVGGGLGALSLVPILAGRPVSRPRSRVQQEVRLRSLLDYLRTLPAPPD